ncbi:putative GTP pyrophosphokinase [Sanguibacter gelidistatuariae]|uniref:Putative GTP pyrophosphokinase n=1 Tax=Sanguibacter gelidistatuariae TaxID=1814289 RepID=A0A1G6MCT7_9MICO|nr:GTP pyrophosphokinase family protein [Sanguibacter gelidistatuariae]SDC53333.1 putative GTP pyrophosphokinase [Sanguibacter gelidistatuariae]
MDTEALTDPIRRALLKDDIMRFLMSYRFGIEEMMTKVNILKDEFHYIHAYNPIEHVSSRLKSPEGILKKAVRKGVPLTTEDIRAQIFDIAGIRVTCSFVSDIYTVRDMITGQSDVTVLEVRDYIKNPKPNGYQSLHIIVSVPVFLSDRTEHVTVEIQIRTIAMDFWASLEHKIYYKYDGAVPQTLLDELKDAADTATRLDHKMERLHAQVATLSVTQAATRDESSLDALRALPIPDGLLDAFVAAATERDDRRGQGGRGPI